MNCPNIQVGIMSAVEVDFNLHGLFQCGHSFDKVTGKHHVVLKNGRIVDSYTETTCNEMLFVPENKNGYFEIQRVTIGIDFHWERTETQNFRGALKIIIDGDKLVVINIIDIEQYLQSVISSEMNATASLEFLKTHAIISRSWLMAQIEKRGKRTDTGEKSCTRSDTEWIQWFDREDHALFDVCADDHCQRYQGITRIVSHTAKEAVEATCGMVLAYDNEICDTRFSKCCGGITETFENTWEQQPHPYLASITDGVNPCELRLESEEQAREWIVGMPDSFCNTSKKEILSQVLNDYDLETQHFFRWKVTYSQNELSGLISKRSGIDFGQIVDLIPLQRGASGRIIRLQIEGTKRSMTIGKELLIRRFLSPSHLYSSAFIVEKEVGKDGIPQNFILHGAGWGHGVGLCQIGAAVMCNQGYNYRQVLAHYYPGSGIRELYK